MDHPESRGMEQLDEAVASAIDSISRALPRTALGSGEELLLATTSRLARLRRLTEAALAEALVEIERLSARDEGADATTGTIARRNGQRDGASLAQHVTRMSRRTVRRLISLGEAVSETEAFTGTTVPARYEALSASALAGDLDAEAAAPVVELFDEIRHRTDAEALRIADAALAAYAADATPEQVRSRVADVRLHLDPDGALPRETRQRMNRSLRLGVPTPDGLTPVHGLLTPDTAGVLIAAMDTFTNPRTAVRFTEEGAPEDQDAARKALDDRSHAQKMHDTLHGLLSAGLSATTTTDGGRRRISQVIATIPLEDLRNGTGAARVVGTGLSGSTETLGPVTAQRIVCDEGFRALLLGDEGEALWLGHDTRYFTPAQRLAVIARDGGCVICDAPEAWCDVHHVTPHAQGGPTDVDNGIALCVAHHHMLHEQGWTIEMRGGVPHLLAPVWMRRPGTWIRLGRSTRIPQDPPGAGGPPRPSRHRRT